jgi:hypothetical protein
METVVKIILMTGIVAIVLAVVFEIILRNREK